MRDIRALRNLRNLTSYRTWEREALWRSGFPAIMAAFGLLVIVFQFTLPLFRRSLTDIEVLFGLYLATALGLMVLAMLRLIAWQRAHPWSPPLRPSTRALKTSAARDDE